MSRFPGRRRPFDVDYHVAAGRTARDSRTFVGFESSDGIEGDEDGLARAGRYRRPTHRRPAASVIGIGDYYDDDADTARDGIGRLGGGERARRRLRPRTLSRDRERERVGDWVNLDDAGAVEYYSDPHHHHPRFDRSSKPRRSPLDMMSSSGHSQATTARPSRHHHHERPPPPLSSPFPPFSRPHLLLLPADQEGTSGLQEKELLKQRLQPRRARRRPRSRARSLSGLSRRSLSHHSWSDYDDEDGPSSVEDAETVDFYGHGSSRLLTGRDDPDGGLDEEDEDRRGRQWIQPPPPPNTHVNINSMLPAPPPLPTAHDLSQRAMPIRSRPGHAHLPVPRSVPASPPSGSGFPLAGPASSAAGGYYKHERLSLSDPRLSRWAVSSSPPRRELTWDGAGAGPGSSISRSRPGSRNASREREYPLQRPHLSPPPHYMHLRPQGPPPPHGLLTGEIGEVREEDLRARLGGVEKERVPLPNPRVPSTNGQQQQQQPQPTLRRRSRRRSHSFDGPSHRADGEGAPRTAVPHRPPRPQYNQVHALILTWSFHDLRAEDYTAPPAEDYVSLEEETARLRATLESYGYFVHEFLIPMHRSLESLKAELKQFLRYAADDTLLIVYYHGHGALDDDNELIFSSHDHPKDAEWAKAAAAELYAALLTGDACQTHGRPDRYQELLKKYERYRPVSSIKWTSIRNPILSAPCDVLLILDCCAAGAAGLPSQEELNAYASNHYPGGGDTAGSSSSARRPYTKHLFAACGFESSTNDYMTTALCEVLGEWVPPTSLPAAAGNVGTTAAAEASRSRSRSRPPPPPQSRSRSRSQSRSQSRPASRTRTHTPSRSQSRSRSRSRSRPSSAEADNNTPPSTPGNDNDPNSPNSQNDSQPPPQPAAAAAPAGGGGAGPTPGLSTHYYLTTKRLHHLVEHKLRQKRSVGSQPIFKQLLPLDPEQYVTLPNLRWWWQCQHHQKQQLQKQQQQQQQQYEQQQQQQRQGEYEYGHGYYVTSSSRSEPGERSLGGEDERGERRRRRSWVVGMDVDVNVDGLAERMGGRGYVY